MEDTTDPQGREDWIEDPTEESGSYATADSGLSDAIYVHETPLLQAHRALLEKIYVSSNDEMYISIKTQYEALKTWHRLHTGWYIERRNDLFRLLRQPCMLTSEYREGKQLVQGARDLVYVLWILWYAANDQIAKRGNGQLFLLFQMLERLSEEWMTAGCIDVLTLGEHTTFAEQPVVMANRKSMARALKYLQVLGCLKELDGQVDIWVERNEPVLYQFTHAIHLLIISLDPETFNAVLTHQKASTIFTEAVLPTQKEKHRALTRAWRALLLGPFFLKCDDPEAFAALTEQSIKVRNEIEVSFGWALEVNHDYACIIRNESSLPSVNLLNPKSAHDHVVLLLCKELRTQVAAGKIQPDYYGRILTTVSYLQDLLVSLRTRFELYWGKGVRDKRDKELLLDTLGKMRRIGFIRGPDSKAVVLILPPAARYSPHYAELIEDKASPGTLRKTREAQDDFRQIDLWIDEKETNDQ